MSTYATTVTPSIDGVAPAAVTSAARVRIVAAALVLGSSAVAATLLLRPGPARNDLSYASFAAVRDGAWAATVVDHVGFIVAAFALAIAVCVLTPSRGAVWANIGAVLTAVGGTLFAGGVIAIGVLGWYATAPDALSPASGTALMTYLAENPGHVSGPQIPGFLLFNLGSLLLAVALWRAGSVPRWLPILWAVLTVAQFVGLPGRMLDLVQVALSAVFVVIAWFTVRATAPTR